MSDTKGSRFDYIKYDQEAQDDQSFFRGKCEEIEQELDNHREGRTRSLAFTALEELYMWIGKMIRDDQVTRTGPQADVPERG